MPVLHADQIPLSQVVGQNVRSAGRQDLLTDAQVIAATSAADLQANITAAVCHADIEPAKRRINRAIGYGIPSGEFSAAAIQACTSVNDVIALTANNDHVLSELP